MYQRTHCTRPCMCCMVVSMELCCPLILHLEYKKILYSVVQGNLSVLNTAVLPLNVLTRCSSLVTIGWVPEYIILLLLCAWLSVRHSKLLLLVLV